MGNGLSKMILEYGEVKKIGKKSAHFGDINSIGRGGWKHLVFVVEFFLQFSDPFSEVFLRVAVGIGFFGTSVVHFAILQETEKSGVNRQAKSLINPSIQQISLCGVFIPAIFCYVYYATE